MTIGRTGDNDLVLTELGVSRRHVRLFVRAGKPHAEDPGNHRTLLNDQPLSEAREVKAGDLLSLGPVVLRIDLLPTREAPPIERVETRVAPPEEGEAPELHRLPTAPAQGGRGGHKVVPIDRAPTAPLPAAQPAIDREPTDPAREAADAPQHSAPVLPPLPSSLIARLQQESEALARSETPEAGWTPPELPATAPRASAPRPALGEPGAAVRASGPRSALAASAGARPSGQKSRPAADLPLPAPPRASGPKVALGVPGNPRSSGARSALPGVADSASRPRPLAEENRPEDSASRSRPLAEENRPTQAGVTPPRRGGRRPDSRWLVAGVIGAAAVVLVSLAVNWLVGGDGAGPAQPSLGAEPLEESFGAGAGVTHPAGESVTFELEAQPEPRVVAVLHFWGEFLSAGELELRLNGSALRHPLVDSGLEAGEVEVVLTREALRPDGENRIEFRRNPGSSVDSQWRLSRLWVERVALPEQEEAALLASALAFAARGREHLDRSAAGPDSLFQAWRAYRSAWLTVEPVRPPHPLYAEARAKYQAIGQSLNERCLALLAAAERSLQGRDAKGARDSLDQVARYFPSGEHRCHNLAVELLAQHGL